LLGRREGIAGDDHWTTVTPHGKVLRPSSSWTTMASGGRCSPVVTLCPHRNRGVHWPMTVGGRGRHRGGMELWDLHTREEGG
jgi:hypothetical protein